MDADVESARRQALKLLERRDYACTELASRLRSRGHGDSAVREVVDRLALAGVLDDARYGGEVAVSLLRSGPVSTEHLVARLESRGIPSEVARDVADATLADMDPVEQAARFATSRRGGSNAPGPAVVRRVVAALARRGFDDETIREALGRCDGITGVWEPEP